MSSGLITFCLYRLMAVIPVALGVTAVSFLMLHTLPGDPAELYVGPEATQAQLEETRDRLGLNAPLGEQYLNFLGNVVTGDLGYSIRTGRPVTDEIAIRLPLTFTLAAMGVTLAAILGTTTALICTLRPHSLLDHIMSVLALISLSTPIYWLGLLLVLAFSIHIPLFPPGGEGSWSHLVLPAVALGLQSAGSIARMTRSSLLEVLGHDYMRTAIAKGISRWTALIRHGLRNAAIPVITVLGLQFGSLLGGAVLTETVFSLNGLGRYVVLSVGFRDFPAVQGAVLVFAATAVTMSFLVDILYAYLDPRIRYE